MTVAESDRLRLVVGIGASTGDRPGLEELVAALPAGAGMAFLVAHPPGAEFETGLVEALTDATGLTITELVRSADWRTAIAPDRVYIVRPGALSSPPTPPTPPATPMGNGLPPLEEVGNTAVDDLLRALARDFGPLTAGIVLSGDDGDGCAGLKAVKAAGGLAVVRAPDASGRGGLPRGAIDPGLADLVLELDEVPAALERFAALSRRARADAGDREADPAADIRFDDAALLRLAALLEQQSGFDIGIYKQATIARRVVRRMGIAGFDDPDAFLAHLRRDGAARRMLVRDLLIKVTDFFRDPDAFRSLREQVIDPLVERAPAGATLRAWVPGCATGEEAYSIGIECLEAIAAQQKRLALQIFATDIDPEAIAFARGAIYPPSIAGHVPAERLRTWFEPLGARGFQVRPPLRDAISFAVHDLTKDPPFSRMDLVSCRNLLIYLTPGAQKHVLEVLHFALDPDGHLMLSPSESTGAHRELFETVSERRRIFRKVGTSPPFSVARTRSLPMRAIPGSRPPAPGHGTHPPRARPAGDDLARRAVLEAWAPPTVIVSADGVVLFMHGELGPYLRFPQGDDLRLDLAALLRPAIATRTRGALYKCRRSGEPVIAHSSPDGERFRITARPAEGVAEGAVMLSFESIDADAPDEAPAERPPAATDDAIIEQLERELGATREDLRHTVEELESSNEQLRSAHEESMSMNEELQSANEELEATTEELRSLNEGLSAVNARLREKVEQLERARDDLHNFFASTEIATVFLDEDLRIARFTPAAAALLDIDRSDLGRAVGDIARALLQSELERDARAVLDQLEPRSRELRLDDGRSIARRVLPYRTEGGRVEGVVVTLTDVTELRGAYDRILTKRRRLELAWEVARGGVVEYRLPPDDSTYVSEQWAAVLGFGVDEIGPIPRFREWLAERVHPEDREGFQRTGRDFIEGRTERYQDEFRVRHRDGEWLWVRSVARALERTDGGRVAHLIGMMLDITDLKRTEAALRESESRFRDMADGLPLIVWAHDDEGRLVHVNETYCDFFGVARGEMTGARWHGFLHPDDADAYQSEFAACVRARRPFHGEVRARHADGSWRWLESWGRPRRTPDGIFCGFVGTSADITERKLIEDALRESEQRFRTLADNIAQLAWMAHGDGWLFWYNQRWYDYTGTTLEEMQGWGWQTVQHPEHVERVSAKYRADIEAGRIWEDTFPLRGADGEYRWFLSRAIPIRDAEGRVVRWFGTNTDVTERRLVEKRLVEADRQKNEFLAMLGHELRNPLAAIRSASDLLKLLSRGDGRLGKTHAILERQTGHMARLLDGLLDVSRIIRGQIRLEPEVVDFAAICRGAIADLTERSRSEMPTLEADLPDAPVHVEADRVRLAQIVDNLLSNAVKYTPADRAITVSLRREADEAVLVVRDTGIGIDAELLPHVFEMFRQSEQTLDRASGGMGLGLALVRSLTELHGGTVDARSDGPDRGAEFTVRLPLTRSAPPQPEPEALGADRPLRILIIEDNPDAGAMLREVLTVAGHAVQFADRARRGLELARERRPDLILCDLGLPDGMTGFDLAREVRADPRLRDVRLVALSGYGRPEDKVRSEEVGFDAHVTKPIDATAIERVISATPRSPRWSDPPR